ncbi:MAG TPA: DUF5715 family protein [Blastocatellia bacterium]|nr:DUF5715 family protein [Blastocatellia bacterium]
MTSVRIERRALRYGAGLACILLALLFANCQSKKQTYQTPPPTVESPQIDPWKAAARKVEEERGEPVGHKAQIEVPAELQHYSDRRRFLAAQVAEARQLPYKPPLDYADLVELIRKNQLVELEPLGKDYILYGVGGSATDEPFEHFDPQTHENIPLYSTDEEFKKEDERLAESLAAPQSRLRDLQSEIRKTPKRDRARRNALVAEAGKTEKSIAAITARKKLIESFYMSRDRRKELSSEYQSLADLAADFGGKSFDLNDPAQRLKFKVRLLSFIRPEARDVLLGLASSYKEKFGRPLPITSLVRPEQYQKQLSETNANATRISMPPHATGLAFDVYYYYMTSEEQDYLMGLIAKLKSEGRVEALRENRHHYHVFVYPDGLPPDDSAIAKEINQTGAKPKAEAKKKKGGKKAAQLAKTESGRRSR